MLDAPPGRILGVLDDIYFREVGNVGLPGPDQGNGGRYLITGPATTVDVPDSGYFHVASPTNHVLAVIRCVPSRGQTQQAFEVLQQIRTYPLGQEATFPATEFVDPHRHNVCNDVGRPRNRSRLLASAAPDPQ